MKENDIDLKKLVEKLKKNRSFGMNTKGVTSAKIIGWLSDVKEFTPGGELGVKIVKKEISFGVNRQCVDGLEAAEEAIDKYSRSVEALCNRVSVISPIPAKSVPAGF